MAKEASVSRICLHSGARSPRFVLSRLLPFSTKNFHVSCSPSRGTAQSCGKAAVRRRANIQSRKFVSSETTEFHYARMARCFPKTFGIQHGISRNWKLRDTTVKDFNIVHVCIKINILLKCSEETYRKMKTYRQIYGLIFIDAYYASIRFSIQISIINLAN